MTLRKNYKLQTNIIKKNDIQICNIGDENRNKHRKNDMKRFVHFCVHLKT